MAVEEQDRQQLYRRLEEILGREEAETLMRHLPPFAWSEVATKSDLAALEERLRAEIRHESDKLRGEMNAGFGALLGQSGELRGEFGELRGEFGDLRGEFGELRGEFGDLRGEFGDLRGEFGELRGEFGDLRGEFGELRGEVRAGLGELRGEMGSLEARMHTEFSKQTRMYIMTTVTAVVGSVGTTAAIAFAAAGLV